MMAAINTRFASPRVTEDRHKANQPIKYADISSCTKQCHIDLTKQEIGPD